MTTDALFNQLKHPNPHLRERAMWALAETSDPEIIPRLLKSLGEPNVSYRRAAVKALGIIGTDSVGSVVDLLLTTEDLVVKASCVKALAQVAFNHPEDPFPTVGLQALNTVLQDPNPVVNIATAMALGEIGVPALEMLTISLQETDNPALAIAILNAISSIDHPQSIKILRDLAQDESADGYVRESAISAVSRVEQMHTIQNLKS
ncbi:MAG: HEAT repeat domain-containing protein [Oscillatoriales cyanobacterium RM2_1_1]|nr:HEAT repeat domain-containing protein [Oscillatoriales cyanobacterium SM2_3_0]NJO45746.1 HEAT repeat domain-containing protein [Oscillatoriales cyanobacterium RM2_1_1]